MKNCDICRCAKCGLQLEVTCAGSKNIDPPVCCGEVMHLQKINAVDAAVEKHVPVVEAREDGILIRVGEVPHPMSPEHFIEWIEVINGAYMNRYHLKPGDLPQAAFYVPLSPKLIIRTSCNIHGLWQKP